MKRKNSLILKQSMKYGLILIVFLFAFFLGRALWEVPFKYQLIGLTSTFAIILIAIIFDLMSVRDVLPIFKG